MIIHNVQQHQSFQQEKKMTERITVQRCILKAYSRGMPDEKRDFEFDTFDLDPKTDLPSSDHMIVRVIYLSVDPGLRSMMTGQTKGYLQPFPLCKSVLSFGLGQVTHVSLEASSASRGHTVGDLVTGFSPGKRTP